MKKTILLGFIFSLIAFACSKDENPEPTPTNGKNAITEITFINNGSDNPTSIFLKNGIENLRMYRVTNTGSVQVKFFGFNGRTTILEGEGLGASSNMKAWDLQPGDTIRAYKNGSIVEEFVSKKLDGFTLRVHFTSLPIEAMAQAKTRLNNYIKNEMPNQKIEIQ
jgi:hypothetical protein